MVSKTFDSRDNSQEIKDIEVYVRPTYSYVSQCQKYLIRDRTFDRQYASFYISRLKIMSSNLQEQARKKWGRFFFYFNQFVDLFSNFFCSESPKQMRKAQKSLSLANVFSTGLFLVRFHLCLQLIKFILLYTNVLH